MKPRFSYTGIRVRDLDGAIEFFEKHLRMKLQSRIKTERNKGEFANLSSKGEKHWLELNWYADDSPVAGPFREGEELDHLGFEVDNLKGILRKLNEAGYSTRIGPTNYGVWDVAFVQGFEDIWLDIYEIHQKAKKRRR
jgi:catechol 2,3-dioxygenase-like lactoylglutathione lyase family enzyme